jgi:hypothetical protein
VLFEAFRNVCKCGRGPCAKRGARGEARAFCTSFGREPTKANNTNTFTWSGPNGVAGFTGQPRVARSEHGAHLSQPGPLVHCAPQEPSNGLSRKGIGRATTCRARTLFPLNRCTRSVATCPTCSGRVTPDRCRRFRPHLQNSSGPAPPTRWSEVVDKGKQCQRSMAQLMELSHFYIPEGFRCHRYMRTWGQAHTS